MSNSGEHGLRTYVIRRVLLMIPTLIGVTFFVFVLCQFVPGGPIDQIRMAALMGGAGESGSVGRDLVGMSPFPRRIFSPFGSIMVLTILFLSGISSMSVNLQKAILELLSGILCRPLKSSPTAFQLSIYYGLITTILTYLVCIPLGIVKAIKHKTFIDNSTSMLIFLGYAIPGYALGAVLLALFAAKLIGFPWVVL